MPQLVEEVEALACCKAVWFALEIGSREIIFKGDTTAVIQVLEKGKKKKKKECVCLNLYEKREDVRSSGGSKNIFQGGSLRNLN